MHAPEFGLLAQALGAHARYQTALPPRLSEFAILCTARLWKRAVRVVRACADGRKGRREDRRRSPTCAPGASRTSAPKDERAIYDFIQELYKTRRVSDRTYKRVHALLGDAAMVELVGILGYYALISMTLNVFNMLPPENEKLAFAEPK